MTNQNNTTNNNNNTLRFSDLSVQENIEDTIRMMSPIVNEEVTTPGSTPVYMSVRDECTVPDAISGEDRLAYVCTLVVLNNMSSTDLSAALDEAEERVLWLSLVNGT